MIMRLDRTYDAHQFIFSLHFYFIFFSCGRLSWLPVSFLLHVKYTLSYCIVLHRLCWKCNCSCVLSRLWNKSSKLYNISSVLNKIVLKIIWHYLFMVWLTLSGDVNRFRKSPLFTCTHSSSVSQTDRQTDGRTDGWTDGRKSGLNSGACTT